MKQLRVYTLFLLGSGAVYAQEALLTAGAEASSSIGTVSYSVGQLLYSTDTGTTGSASQGVQQPYQGSITLGNGVTATVVNFSLYPNPTTDKLILTTESLEHFTLNIHLYDITGKVLRAQALTENTTTIRMEDLPSATYFLQIYATPKKGVSSNQEIIRIAKIIKY